MRLRRFRWLLLAPLLALLALVVSTLLLSALPWPQPASAEDESVLIFVRDNGIHTDLLLPYRHPLRDWGQRIRPEHFGRPLPAIAYISIGWGHKQFYLETPTWDDLSIPLVLKSLAHIGPAIYHIEQFEAAPDSSATCRPLRLSAADYRGLCAFVDDFFAGDAPCAPGYAADDTFFDASGDYGFFYNCNAWTRGALRAAGQGTCVWTSIPQGVMWHLE